MKITVRHNQSEIVIDEIKCDTTIKYSIAEIIKVIGKMSLEIQNIESNYNKEFENK